MSWESWEKSAEKGPTGSALKAGCAIIFVVMCLSVIGYIFGWFSEAASVAQKEFGPKAMLAKYEEFKNDAAALESKLASIDVFEKQIVELKNDKKDWTRADKEAFYLKQSEVAGMKASFNTLAAKYNANMAKFNYSFANVGELPAGAKRPLPREFKAYLSN